MSSSRTRAGVWLTVGSGLAFASSGPLAKSVLAVGWSPGAVLAIRLSGAAAIMLTLAALSDPSGLRGSLRHLRTVGGFGVIAVAGVQASFFLSLPYLQVGVTLMIQFLAAIAVIAWNWAVRGRRPSGATLLGAAIALGGAALVIDIFGADGISLIGLGWAAVRRIGRAGADDRRRAGGRRHRAGPQRRRTPDPHTRGGRGAERGNLTTPSPHCTLGGY